MDDTSADVDRGADLDADIPPVRPLVGQPPRECCGTRVYLAHSFGCEVTKRERNAKTIATLIREAIKTVPIDRVPEHAARLIVTRYIEPRERDRE